ncbi:hypothetical protein N7462_009796 [Penicillium macrosclerotiorum]|uniref:uncharacterized protein n=1 Tax=Penicillium macrosclerotiorum TaxID=303699 RepID=UPI00254763F7|nr:uncharacterized protein N7462_009796 [Penicillium macrosclerotiorum]KAJ5668726.1 hypothetical protein N7462_009796 [Penicillium macrosclerotiorum]
MARHGHYRHDRIDRIIRAKHLLEESETDHGPDNKIDMHLGVDIIQNPVLHSSEILSTTENCDPLQNITCPDDIPDTTEILLSKRQEAEAASSTVVETVVQVVDTNSQTLWQSAGVSFPITISNTAFGALTITGGSTTPTEPSTATSASSTSQPTSSTAGELSVPTALRQSAAFSSQRVSSAISSVPYTSTRLVSSSSTTTPLTTSTVSWWGGVYTVASSSSTTGTYSSEPSMSTVSHGGAEETGSGTRDGSAQTTSQSQSSSGSGSSIDPRTSKIVGGVVGSVAGLSLIILLLFYLFRRRKMLQSKNGGALPLPSDDAGTREVAERRSSNDPLFTASYFAPAFMKRWRQSTMTTKTESTVSSNASERGFQKISGRKIPPVLTHGGDGYGGGLDGDSPTLPGFSPISPGGGPLSSTSSHGPPPTSPYGIVLDTTFTREAEERNNTPSRPPPVQLPVSSSVNFGTPTTVNPSHPIAQPQSAIPVAPLRPDGLGRSLPSFDGSRSSRFTESIDR